MTNETEVQKSVEELQVLEHNIQQFMAQKQMVQVEMNEISTAQEELNKTKDEVFKILGPAMIKTDKETLLKELEDKNKVSILRLSSIEKQEKLLEDRALELKKEIDKNMNKKK